MEDWINTHHWLLVPFGPFILVILAAIIISPIALLVVLIRFLIRKWKG